MSDFDIGDIVKLKCSPQKMVIEAQNGPLKFICVWIEDYGTPHREAYNPGVLEHTTRDMLDPSPKQKPDDEERPSDNLGF